MNQRLIYLIAVTAFTLTACATNATKEKEAGERAPASTDSADTENASNYGKEEEETPWTTWSEKNPVKGLLVLKKIRENLFENNLHDPHSSYAGYGSIKCTEKNRHFRSADGTCTDMKNPYVGAAGVAFGRNVPPEFIDQDAQSKLMTPNPAEVSKEMFTRGQMKEVPFLNMLAASWIQFMNHDWLSHGKNMEQDPIRVEGKEGSAGIVERTKENDIRPGQYKAKFGKTMLNDVTHWWDGSQIYGSNQEQQNDVRSFKNGKMRMEIVNGREVLPKNASLDTVHNKQNNGYEVTGFRDNWWVGLSMLHHLFVKEHNTVADMLMKKHVTYNPQTKKYTWTNGKEVLVLDEKGIDEQIFQTARLVNAALMAKIHTVEWTPAILANKVLKVGMMANWYGVANPQAISKRFRSIPFLNQTDWFDSINLGKLFGGIVGGKLEDNGTPYSITEEFTSVYRLHSLLPEKIYFKKLSNRSKVLGVNFVDTRNEKSYNFFANNDLKDLFYSFGTQHPGQLVLNNFPKFMQELPIPGHGIMDLGMVDIIRDRERGVPRYNQFRRALGLKPIRRYSDFFSPKAPLDARQKEVIAKLTKLYGKTPKGGDNVEMIDLLVGTLAEEVRPKNFGFGETQFQIFILMASRRLMADRFYTTDYTKENYTKDGLEWIDREGTMAQIIVRHMPELKDKVAGIDTAFAPWNP